MPQILIVEDQVLIANHIKNILTDCNYTNVELTFNLKDATLNLQQFEPRIILLDINVEGHDTGIEWAKRVLNDEKVIFITGQTEMETLKKALTIQPIAYLTKPVKKIDLIAAIEVAKEQLKVNSVIVKDGYNEVKILFDEILFIKSDKNYIDITTYNKIYSIRTTLDSFYKELDETMFCKVHRSYIVNKTKISLKSGSFVKIEQHEIPISRDLDLSI